MTTDIAIEHTYSPRAGGAAQTFTLHPFENTCGEHAGRYAILRDISGPGERQRNRSAHITVQELAELYARGLPTAFAIRLRLRPRGITYPDAPPAKLVPVSCIQGGSDFADRVSRVDTALPVSVGLRAALKRIAIDL